MRRLPGMRMSDSQRLPCKGIEGRSVRDYSLGYLTGATFIIVIIGSAQSCKITLERNSKLACQITNGIIMLQRIIRLTGTPKDRKA